ncbi:MAG TPA: hypothetical protein VF618_13720 [Thermoanaerobaculia bacterium]
MITKNEWDEAIDDYLAAERERLGPPPTAEELAAYRRGALSEEGAARVRALLVCWPDVVFEEEVQPVRRLPFLRYLPVAAVTTLAFIGGMLVPRLAQQPKVFAQTHVLRPAVSVRGTPVNQTVSVKEDSLLILTLDQHPSAATYRLEIVEPASSRVVRRFDDLPPQPDDTFAVELRGVAAGQYRLDLYGDGELLANYLAEVQ